MNDCESTFRRQRHGRNEGLRRTGFTAAALLGLALVVGGNPDTWGTEAAPTAEWVTSLPEGVGLDSAALADMFDFVREHHVPVHSVQIVRHGKLALDAYFYPFNSKLRHDVASVTKSVTSTLIGLAIQDHLIRDVQQPALSFFPERTAANPDPRKQRMTLEHLLTMQAGWDCGFEPKEARLGEMRRTMDWLQFMLDLPMVAVPGTRFAYCSGNPHVLSMILSRVTGTNALAFARRELFEPLGIQDVAWPMDPEDNNHGWGDLQMRPRDMAKLGQLFLQRGRWNGRPIIAETWVRAATQAQVERTVNRDHYGYLWWVKGDDYPGMFEAVGRGGQRITVWPAKELVVVFTGGGFEPGDLGQFILAALKSAEPLPANPVAVNRLRERLVAATRPPRAKLPPGMPAVATQISGKNFQLSANGLSLSTLRLEFTDLPAAIAEVTLGNRSFRFPVGLDGVERLSPNPLTHLPQAALGEWRGGQTFLLRLDLVGAINCYQLILTFSADGKTLNAKLTERTGLNDEKITGTLANDPGIQTSTDPFIP